MAVAAQPDILANPTNPIAVTPRPLPEPYSRTTLAQKIDKLLSEASIPGCVIAVCDQRTRRVIWEHAFGMADVAKQVPCDVATTAFHLFSGTKLFTAAAVMHLVQSGRLSLDASVRDLLSERSVPKEIARDYGAIVDKLEHVTVAHLLSHSSGLTDSPLSAVFGVDVSPSPSSARPDLSRVLARFRISTKPKPVPDSRKRLGRIAKYANVNYLLLAEVVSQVAGCGFEEYVYTNVLGPAGSQAQFSCATIGCTSNPMATGAVTGSGIMRSHEALTSSGSHRRRSTTRDLARGYVNWWNKWALVAMLGVTTSTKLFEDGVGWPLLGNNNKSGNNGTSSFSTRGVIVGQQKKKKPLAWFSSNVPLADFDLKASAVGGLVGTAADFLPIFNLASDVRSGGGGDGDDAACILNPDTIADMLDLHAVGACGVRSKVGMGYGWKHGACHDGTTFFNHEGGGGGFTSELRFYPDEALGIVLMCNKWTLNMHECVVAHKICEEIRNHRDVLLR
jgi:CubicO group peptidase (beta-lactamase class C family)